MANKYTVMSEEATRYLCGLIRNVVSLPSEIISNISLADNLTFSNIYIKDLVEQCLLDAKDYADLICGSLTKLTCEKTTIQPTLDNSELNIIYLFSDDGNAPFEQYLKISETELIDMGSTSISLNNYLTATQIASTYAKKVDLDTLTTEVTNIKSDFNTHKDDTDVHITADERTKWNNATKEEKIKEIVDSEMTAKGVCTTSVTDVRYAKITFSNNNNYYNNGCSYFIKNGICTLTLLVNCNSYSNAGVTVANVPKPFESQYTSLANAEGNNRLLKVAISTGGGLLLSKGTNGDVYTGTFLYLVAES